MDKSRVSRLSHQKLFRSITKYARPSCDRIFVNRSLHMKKIKYIGFDMDYTLAEYISPEYELLGYSQAVERLISIGYPEEIRESTSSPPMFNIRCLWFDKKYGNHIKADTFGNILSCVHGFRFLDSQEISQLYPNKFVELHSTRIELFNTLYSVPEVYALAFLVEYFTEAADYKETEDKCGVYSNDNFLSWKSITEDVRDSFNFIHEKGDLKRITTDNLEKYIRKDSRVNVLLRRIRENGRIPFLLTNSAYSYTNTVMKYLLEDEDNTIPWQSYFDYIVVNARKPSFFEEGSALRSVNMETGEVALGSYNGPSGKGGVYSGGNADLFSDLIGCRGKDVLYVGDHVFGDILRSKKKSGWRTFLIVPELIHELKTWIKLDDEYIHYGELEAQLAEVYKGHDSSVSDYLPKSSDITGQLKEVSHEIDQAYGFHGSIFRSGSRITYFSFQIMKYADIYSHSILNLLNYPFCYMFRAPWNMMPHELSLPHGEEVIQNTEANHNRKKLMKAKSMVGSIVVLPPDKPTYYHDNDED